MRSLLRVRKTGIEAGVLFFVEDSSSVERTINGLFFGGADVEFFRMPQEQ